MNSKAKKLVEDNHNLIYGFAKNRGIDLDNNEDFYGLLSEALCRASIKFDETQDVTFSTFAYTYMDKAVKKWHYTSQMHKRVVNVLPKISLDAPCDDCDDGSTLLGEMIPDERVNQDERIDVLDTVSCLWNIASKSQKEYLSLVYEGFKPSEISRMLGISQQAVNYRKQTLIKNFYAQGYKYEVN